MVRLANATTTHVPVIDTISCFFNVHWLVSISDGLNVAAKASMLSSARGSWVILPPAPTRDATMCCEAEPPPSAAPATAPNDAPEVVAVVATKSPSDLWDVAGVIVALPLSVTVCQRLGQRAGTVVAVLEMVGAQRDTHVTYLTFWVPDGVLRPPPPSDFAAATGIGRFTCKREPCTMPSVLIGDSSSATPRIVRLEP